MEGYDGGAREGSFATPSGKWPLGDGVMAGMVDAESQD